MQKDKPTKFPAVAKQVFEGIIFDVYHWPQVLYDGTTATYERLKRQDTAIIIGITPDKKILMVDEEQPLIPLTQKFIAGKKDFGESIEQAAERELLEETGYQAAKLDLWFKHQPDLSTDWTVYTYIARGITKVAEPQLEGGEKIHPKLLTFDEFIDFALSDKFHAYLIKIIVLEAKLDPEKMTDLKKLMLG